MGLGWLQVVTSGYVGLYKVMGWLQMDRVVYEWFTKKAGAKHKE